MLDLSMGIDCHSLRHNDVLFCIRLFESLAKTMTSAAVAFSKRLLRVARAYGVGHPSTAHTERFCWTRCAIPKRLVFDL